MPYDLTCHLELVRLYVSALDKVAEFRRLRYPLGLLRKACAYIATTSGPSKALYVKVSALTALDVKFNELGEEGEKELRMAALGRGFKWL